MNDHGKVRCRSGGEWLLVRSEGRLVNGGDYDCIGLSFCIHHVHPGDFSLVILLRSCKNGTSAYVIPGAVGISVGVPVHLLGPVERLAPPGLEQQ